MARPFLDRSVIAAAAVVGGTWMLARVLCFIWGVAALAVALLGVFVGSRAVLSRLRREHRDLLGALLLGIVTAIVFATLWLPIWNRHAGRRWHAHYILEADHIH